MYGHSAKYLEGRKNLATSKMPYVCIGPRVNNSLLLTGIKNPTAKCAGLIRKHYKQTL